MIAKVVFLFFLTSSSMGCVIGFSRVLWLLFVILSNHYVALLIGFTSCPVLLLLLLLLLLFVIIIIIICFSCPILVSKKMKEIPSVAFSH